MTSPERELARRRMHFVAGEDLYFLTYTTLLVLDEFGCTSNEKALRDFRKVAFVADFVASPRLAAGLTLWSGQPARVNREDRDLLRAVHDRGVARIQLVFRLLYVLENRGLVAIESSEKARLLSLHLCEAPTVRTLIDNDMFQPERRHIGTLRKVLPKFRSASLPYVLDGLFGRFGVSTWLG
jgi:hypothetical protein